MTFDPVLPPLVLGAIAVVLAALRLLALRPAARAGHSALLRWSGMTLALALLLTAAAGRGSAHPPMRRPTAAGSGANIFFVVDRSADSAVADFGGAPRMAGIRADIEAVIDAHPGARFALLAFAARPAIDWPLSGDAWSLRPVVQALTPYPDASAAADQVNAAAAANVLRYQLISAGQQYPGAQNLVYYFGSGAPQSSVPQGEFDGDGVDGGAVFDYGRAGDRRLRAIADQLGVPYVERGPGEPLPPSGTAPPATAAASVVTTGHRDEFYWALTLVASLLLLAEIGRTVRELRRSRSTRREALT